MKKLTVRFTIVLSLALSAVAPVRADSKSVGSSAVMNKAATREQSALLLIERGQEYNASAARLIAQAQKTMQEAQHLTGSANRYESILKPKFKPLTGAKLATARQLFKSDLELFEQHAKDYREHTQQVRAQVGECEASRRAYQLNKEAYSLHCKEYHLPNLPPPHVCIVLGRTMEENISAAAKVRDNMKRMIEAETQLMQAEQRLGNAIKSTSVADQDARRQNEINLREQNLVAEFGRLQEEYRQLEVERSALRASGVRDPVASVSAKLRARSN